MKKLLLTFVCALTVIGTTFAQFDVEVLEGGARLGYAKPIGDFGEFAKGGITYNAFIAYKINEKISVGAEYIGTIAAGISDDDNLSAFGLTSILAIGTYKFLEDTDFVPYATVGLGVSIVEDPFFIDKQTGFGANAELGFSYRGFNLAYAFNVAGKSTNTQTEESLPVNFHSFLIGYTYNF